jgi:single-strand DNA-binding protein
MMALLDDDDDDGDFFASSSPSTNANANIKTRGGDGANIVNDIDDEETPMSIEELEMLATPFDPHLPQINAVTLVGRVGNDPMPKYFDDGKVVLNLSLAVKRKYHPLERKVREIKSGMEETDWFPLEFWGRDAEYVNNFVEKGTRLGITGSLIMDGWIDKATGEQRRRPKVLVRQIDIIESRAEAELRRGNAGNGGGGGGGKGWGGGGGGKGGGGYRGGGGENDDGYDEDGDGGPSPAGTGGFFS